MENLDYGFVTADRSFLIVNVLTFCMGTRFTSVYSLLPDVQVPVYLVGLLGRLHHGRTCAQRPKQAFHDVQLSAPASSCLMDVCALIHEQMSMIFDVDAAFRLDCCAVFNLHQLVLERSAHRRAEVSLHTACLPSWANLLRLLSSRIASVHDE